MIRIALKSIHVKKKYNTKSITLFNQVYGLDQKVIVLNDPHNFANDDFWLTCVANNVEVLLTIGEDKVYCLLFFFFQIYNI